MIFMVRYNKIENLSQNHQKNSNMSRVRAFISPSKYWRARYTRVCPSDKGGGPREAVKPEESPVCIVVPVVKHSLWCRDVAFLHFYCLSYIFRAVRNMGRIPRKAAINNASLIDCRNLFECRWTAKHCFYYCGRKEFSLCGVIVLLALFAY